MRQCPYCGSEVSGSLVTCPQCGRSLAAGVERGASGVPARESRRLPGVIAILTVVVLIVGASVVWFLASRASTPEPRFEPDLAGVAPGESQAQTFVGCVGPTDEADTFVLSVSRVEEREPQPPGTPVPRKPTTRAGVPLTGGTPQEPPVAGTGEPPVGGTPGTNVVTYVLVGSGGLTLGDLVGDTIEVTGVLDEREQPGFPRLHVTSARQVASDCGRP